MKLKKLISIAGTLAIVLSMITLPVKADLDLSWWHMDETALVDVAGDKRKVVNALGGKESGTVYQFLKQGAYMRLNANSYYGANGAFTDASYCLTYPKPNEYNADPTQTMQSYEGYMIFSFNIYPTTNSQQFRITRRGGGYVSGVTTTTEANGFVINQWNKVDIFVRLSATGGNGGNRYASTYVNGKYVWRTSGNSYHSLFSLTSGQEEDLRFGVPEDGTNRYGFYIDDLYVAFTTETPAIADIPTAFSSVLAMPTLSDIESKAVVNNSDKTIGICGKTTVSELASANSSMTVRAYSNSAFSSQLGSADALAEGNTVVAEDSHGRIVYYSVTEEDLVWSLNNADVVETAYIDHDASDSLGAKTGDGTALRFQAVEDGTTETYRRLNSVGEVNNSPLTTPLSDMTQYEGYMIVSMNVYSDGEEQRIAITTNTGSVVMGGEGFIIVNKKYGAMDKGRWHHVVSAIRLKDGERTATTYIDGKQKFQRNHYLYSSASYTDVRLTTSKNARGDVYFDDVKITFTNSLPDMDTLSALPEPTNNFSSEANIYGDQFVISSGQTVDSTSLSITDGTVTVYTDGTLTATVSSGDLSEGNVIVVENSEDTMAYYTVFDNFDPTPYVKENGVTLTNFGTGTMCFGRKLILPEEKELIVVAAQYTSDESRLIKFTSATGTYSGVSDINVDSAITETAGTKVKLFIWENDGYLSVCDQAVFTP